MRRVYRVLGHLHSLKGGSIEIFENLCSKIKVILQCLFMPYCKGANVIKREQCNSYLHIYIVSRLFFSNDFLSVEIIVLLHIPIKPFVSLAMVPV